MGRLLINPVSHLACSSPRLSVFTTGNSPAYAGLRPLIARFGGWVPAARGTRTPRNLDPGEAVAYPDRRSVDGAAVPVATPVPHAVEWPVAVVARALPFGAGSWVVARPHGSSTPSLRQE